MILFEKPTNLNGGQLLNELESAGYVINREFNPVIDADGNLLLDVSNKDASKVAEIVAKHNGNIISNEPTIADKLALVGLNLDDLKTALGIDA